MLSFNFQRWRDQRDAERHRQDELIATLRRDTGRSPSNPLMVPPPLPPVPPGSPTVRYGVAIEDIKKGQMVSLTLTSGGFFNVKPQLKD